MFVVALGEILVLVLLRPLRFVTGGERTLIGRALLRFERWLLRQLHVMGAEERMRYELEQHGNAAATLAEGLSDKISTLPSTSDTIERARRESGANHDEALNAEARFAERELGRGQRRVDSGNGDRSTDIHQAMLEAQRRQQQTQQRQTRRARRHSSRRS